METDNLHHKYTVEYKYPQDLIELGRMIGVCEFTHEFSD